MGLSPRTPRFRVQLCIPLFHSSARLQDRYREISAHLLQANLSFTVPFSYLPNGVRIRGKWFPVLKMQWVDGTTLNTFVRDNVQKPSTLDALGQLWVKLAQRLRAAGLAHADLQHGNVLLVPTENGGQKLQLIDYDGMFVPTLARSPSGIISAKGRRNLELGSKEIEIQDFFQTDAAINPGNSGGPLLNLRGQIVGINTAIASNSGGNEGIGFSIPINMAMTVAEQLVTRGKLQRSYLGVVLENTFDSLTAQRLGLPSTAGAHVKSIIPSSPAHRMDLQVGDVIVEFDGVRVENDGHLVKTVGLTPVGRNVHVVFYREGKRLRSAATLDPNPDQ